MGMKPEGGVIPASYPLKNFGQMSVALYSCAAPLTTPNGLRLNLRQPCAPLRLPVFGHMLPRAKSLQADSALETQLAPALRALAPADTPVLLAPELAPTLRALAPVDATVCCHEWMAKLW